MRDYDAFMNNIRYHTFLFLFWLVTCKNGTLRGTEAQWELLYISTQIPLYAHRNSISLYGEKMSVNVCHKSLVSYTKSTVALMRIEA